VGGNRRRWYVLVGTASVATGLTQLASKAYASLAGRDGVGPGQFNYLAWMFAVGVLALLLLGEHRRLRLRSPEMRVGVAMGLLNVVAAWGVINALTVLEGIVVFPIKAGCGVALTAFLAIVAFGERITLRQGLGIAVGIASVVLVNLT
jgi:drug/metabolite transporter (DMT)-like permease